MSDSAADRRGAAVADTALDLIQARFDAHGLTLSASEDTGRFFGQCVTHRKRTLALDFDAGDDVMRLHAGDCGCLPGEVIRLLGLERTVPNVPASIRTDRARRMLGVKTAFRELAGAGDGYTRMTLALEAAGANGSRSDPGGVRGEGRYQCPSCGAKGDGHGLRVTRKDDGNPKFTCFAQDCPGDEILAALDLSWVDIGWKPDDAKVKKFMDSLPDGPFGEPAVKETGSTRISLVKLSDVQRERVDWLWPGYLARGKLHVIDGDPGLGKSTATADWGARTSTGKPWPDGQPGCRPAGVVLLSAEDGLGDTIRPRLEAAGADLDRVVALTGITSCDSETGELYERLPSLPGDIGKIRAAIEKVGAALVIIDPLMAYLGGDVNSHRDQDVRRALAPLAKMAEETGAAVLLIRHNTKGGGNNALYRGGGSIGIIGAARLGFTFARDPEDETRVIVACTKANITVISDSLAYRLVDCPDYGCAKVEWHDGPVNYTADDLLAASQETADDRADRNDAAAWLKSYLIDNGGEAEAGDVIKAGEKSGFQKHTLQRARQRVGVRSEKAAFDAGWMWRLNVEGDTKMTKVTEPSTLPSSSSSMSSSMSSSDPVTFRR